jgi:hypothetical protein
MTVQQRMDVRVAPGIAGIHDGSITSCGLAQLSFQVMVPDEPAKVARCHPAITAKPESIPGIYSAV